MLFFTHFRPKTQSTAVSVTLHHSDLKGEKMQLTL